VLRRVLESRAIGLQGHGCAAGWRRRQGARAAAPRVGNKRAATGARRLRETARITRDPCAVNGPKLALRWRLLPPWGAAARFHLRRKDP
jgi:hypothetical protein